MRKSSFSSGDGKRKAPFSLAKHFLAPGRVSFALSIPTNTHGRPSPVAPNQSLKLVKDRTLKGKSFCHS